MLSDKQINEISAHANWEVRFLHRSLIVVIRDAIEKALALAEKSKWKYPDKGELPEINKWLDFVVPHWPGRHVGRFVKGIEDDLCFWCELAKTYFSTDKVKAWTYAPVMEEG